jgi:uncharacterized protein
MKLLRTTCPHCGEPALADTSNPWRPFCSERCRLIDLGAWLEGSHRIPGEEAAGVPTNESGSDEPTRH